LRLIQYCDAGEVVAARVVDSDSVEPIQCMGGVYALARTAIESKQSLAAAVEQCGFDTPRSYQALIEERCLLSPVMHPDPARMLVTGTGLTHLGSAASRASMHAKLAADAELTDSIKMFKHGLQGGKPAQGTGFQPEWFYKGDGSIIVAPEQPFSVPDFGLDAGEEPELVGLYLIADDGEPQRIGFALGNELSDHVTEQFNYLWLAHSKLRPCSFGPEVLVDDAPTDGNLEHHHFKYGQFRRPGDVHAHFFGTATLSFADGVKTQLGDQFEIHHPAFGRPLRNPLARAPADRAVRVPRL
jgi:hypothetical protein